MLQITPAFTASLLFNLIRRKAHAPALILIAPAPAFIASRLPIRDRIPQEYTEISIMNIYLDIYTIFGSPSSENPRHTYSCMQSNIIKDTV